MNRHWRVATTAGTVAGRQVADVAGADAVRSSMSRLRRLPGWVRGRDMAISDRDISGAFASYLERYPEEAALLSEPVRLLSQGGDFASRRSFPLHVTVGVLLVRGAEVLLVEHRAYGIVLQNWRPSRAADVTLTGAAERELA